MKLQKLLYFAWGWYLTLYDQQLFKEHPKAWTHGPVFPNVYQRFKGKGKNSISAEDMVVGNSGIGHEVREFLDNIWDEYGQYSAEKLVDITHIDPAWIQGRTENAGVMQIDIIKNYFQKIQEDEQKKQDLFDLSEVQNRDKSEDLSVYQSFELLKSITL